MNTIDIEMFNMYNVIDDITNHEFEYRQAVDNGLLEYRHVNAENWRPLNALFLESLSKLLTWEGHVLNTNEIRKILHQSNP